MLGTPPASSYSGPLRIDRSGLIYRAKMHAKHWFLALDVAVCYDDKVRMKRDCTVLRRLIDLWLARSAQPSQAALQAVAQLKPITVVTGGSRGIGLALAR